MVDARTTRESDREALVPGPAQEARSVHRRHRAALGAGPSQGWSYPKRRWGTAAPFAVE